MSNRIHLLGGSGSGTSSLGIKLAEKLEIPHFESDDFFWQESEIPFTVKRTVEDRIKILEKTMDQNESWVISGSASEWGDSLLERSTLIVLIECDKEVRLDRIRKREKERFGDRILPGNDMYKVHSDFLIWAAGYDTGDISMRSKASHLNWLEGAKCPVIEIKNDLFEESLDRIMSSLYNHSQ